MKRHWVSMLLAVTFCLSLLPGVADAVDGTDTNITVEVNPGMEWDVTDETNTTLPADSRGSEDNYDISWYDANKTGFTINTAEQLAGVSVLVQRKNNFSGKTINLGNDINLQTKGTSVLNAEGTLNTISLKIWTPIGDA